nr:TROVE domain-containing protein [uncultured Ruminococcus sp.]
MAKFNFKNTDKTVNREGFPAYKMQDKEQLVTAVLTTMFGEPKFYGSTDNDSFVLATVICGKDPAFVAKLACYARNVANMRSVSHVLACIIAHEAHEYTRAVIRNIIVRPDDITEIMACYKQMYGKPFPNALKREIAKQIQRFDEYALAKYNSRGMSMKLRDVLRITHPTPKDEKTEALFRKVLDDTLETPYTWETELSEKGNTKEVWDELISSGKVGYMALLRNLRNIVKCGADIAPVLKVLSDPERVKKSRQLPFRFFSAYRMLEQENLMTPEIHRALENALTVSVENLDTVPGRTLIAVDVSGSMGSCISRKSTVMCSEIAGLLGAMSSRICEDAAVCYFDCPGGWSCLRGDKGYIVEHYGKYDSILEICRKHIFSGGGTRMDLPMKFALEEDKSASIKPFDRVIYFSDNVCNSSSYGIKTVQSMVDKYRKKYNPDFWVHGVDLQGYGTQQFCGKNFNLIAGWSDKVLEFILLAEKGIGSLVQTIEEYQMK